MKKHNILTKITTYSLVLTLVLGLIISADIFYPENFTHAAQIDTSTISNTNGLANPDSAVYNEIPPSNPSPNIPINIRDYDLPTSTDTGTKTVSCTCKCCGDAFTATVTVTSTYHPGGTHIVYTDDDGNIISRSEWIAQGSDSDNMEVFEIPGTNSTTTGSVPDYCPKCAARGSTQYAIVKSLYADIDSLTDSLNNANAQIVSKNSQITILTDENSSLKTQVNNLTSQKNDLETANANLQGTINDKNKTIEDLNKEIKELSDKIAKNEGDITSLTTERDTLQQKVNELTSEVASLKRQIEEKNTQIANLNAEITSLKEGIEGLKNEKAAKEARIKELDEKIAKNEGNIEALTAEKEDCLENIKSLNAKIDDDDKKISHLSELLSKTVTELDSLDLELNATQTELAEKILHYDQEIDAKEKELNQLKRIKTQNEEDAAALREEIINLADTITALYNSREETIAEYTNRINNLNEQITAGKLKETELSAKLDTANGGIKKLEDEVARLSTEVTELSKNNETLQAKLQEKEDYYTALLARFKEQLELINATNNGLTYEFAGQHYVCVNGHDYPYDPNTATEATIIDENDNEVTVTCYLSSYDTDGDGILDSSFWFFIYNGSVYRASFNEDGTIKDIERSETTIADIVNAIQGLLNSTCEELSKAREKIAELRSGIDEIYNSIEVLLNELGIEFDILEPNPDEPTPDNADAEKLLQIIKMIKTLGDSYKGLQANYNQKVNDYNALVAKIYGLTDPTDVPSDVDVNEIINAIQTERDTYKAEADSLNEEIKSLKEEAENTEKELRAIIAEAISATDEATRQNTELSDEVRALVDEVNSLRQQAEIDAETIRTLQSALDTMKTFVKTLATALGLDNVEDTAAILSSVQNLKTQVQTLTNENATLTQKVSDLNKQIESLNLACQSAYNAGYEAGKKAGGGSGQSNSEEIKSLNKKIEDLNKQIEELSSKLKDESSAKCILSSENESLKEELRKIKTEYEEISGEKGKLAAANNALKKKATELWRDKNNLNKQVNKLKSSNGVLSDSVSRLQAELDAARKNGTTDNNDNQEEEKEEEEIPVDKNAGLILSHLFGRTLRVALPIVANADDDNLELLNYSGSYVADFDSNCQGIEESSVTDKTHANTLFTHYFENLSDLSDLGFKDAMNLEDDKEHALSLQALTSLELIPTDEQKAVIASGQSVKIQLESSSLEDGTYILVHESKDRPDNYDIMIIEATNHSLCFELADLSPVSIAKLQVVKNTIAMPASNPTPMAETVSKNKPFKTLYLVIGCIIILLGIAGVYLYMQNNKSPRRALKK